MVRLSQKARDLERKALKIREMVIEELMQAGAQHVGSSLSPADIVTALFFEVMRHDPKNPHWQNRDRFVLSKGHACALLYVVLAECGFFPREVLSTYKRPSSILQGHPNMKLTPGVEISSGSLGQGLSVAVGIAIGGKVDCRDFRVFALIGDGKSQEGQIWEAAMAGAHYKLDNLTAILDYNKCSAEARICDSMALEPLVSKWQSFGWHTLEIDGHNMEEILEAFNSAKKIKEKPTMILAHTVKGKGVSFAEDKVEWHAIRLSKEKGEQALRELREEK